MITPLTTDRRHIVEGIWNCLFLLHRSGRLPQPSVELLIRFGAEDRVTEQEAMDVTIPRGVFAKKEQAA